MVCCAVFCVQVLVAGVVSDGGGPDVFQFTGNPERGLRKTACGSGVLLRLRWVVAADLKSGDLCGDLPRPMCHRGNVLVVFGEALSRSTKQKVICDGAASDLGLMDSVSSFSGVRFGGGGAVRRWVLVASARLSRDYFVFSVFFEGLCAVVLGHLCFWCVLVSSRALCCSTRFGS